MMNGVRALVQVTSALLLSTSASVLASDATLDEGGTITVVGTRYHVPVITSATRTDTSLRDVPQAVTVVTRDLIDDQAMRSVADVLRYVPGAQIAQGEGHRDQIVLRGNNSTADFFLDGLRDDVQYYRDLYNVERIEVLKGPNAMIFGRGGGGGVVNRVTKKADGEQLREIMLQGGSFDQKRAAVDIGGSVGSGAAVRLNGFYEDSGGYRDFFQLERFGINPVASFGLGSGTTLRIGYEHVEDDRTVDRGVPSDLGLRQAGQVGRPFATGRSQFFGNPDASYATTNVDLLSADLEHDLGGRATIRSRLLLGDYDKFYQNVFASSPVSLTGVAQSLELAAYNSATERRNILSQTDLVLGFETGPVRHRLLAGVELGRQDSINSRNEGRFPTTTLANIERLRVSAGDPVSTAPVVFGRASFSNDGDATILAVYLQDQVDLTPDLQLVAGLRFDRFRLELTNRLTGQRFERTDNLWSPRAGLVYRPTERLSVYGSYSLSYLPQSGDQFAGLDITTQALKPEKFENIEVGAKWQPLPGLLVSIAAYRLDRDNTRGPAAAGGTVVLTGSQRSKGVEFEVNGALASNWNIIAGLAIQDAEITSATNAAPAGRKVALVPRTTASLWSAYRFTPRFGLGAGFTAQSRSFTTVSNAVELPGFVRLDAALFYTLTDRVRLQANLENLANARYFPTAHNDNNITPGSPRAARVSLIAGF